MRTVLALGVLFVCTVRINRPTPLILERNEGETRIWRLLPGDPLAPSRFILKVDPINGGSEHMVLGTEAFAPGDSIETHHHPSADEIVILDRGSARVHLGAIVRDIHAGGVVFIPAHTSIAFQFTGRDSSSVTFIFSSPGFEQYMRAESVRAGEKNVPMTRAESDSIDKRFAHHVVYAASAVHD